MVHIDDPTDERVSDFAGLSDLAGRSRREAASADGDPGFFVVEGPLVVRRLIRSAFRVRSLLVTDRGLRALGAEMEGIGGAPVFLASQEVVDAIGGFNFHRGALASADRRALPPMVTLVEGVEDVVVMIEGVNDHENLGALFRNAAAFGAGAVVLDPTTADPLYRRCTRVSVGHVLSMPFTRAAWPAAITQLQDQGFEVLALTPSADAEDIRDVADRRRQALLVGAEGPGLSAAALAAADRRVKIAMAGGVDSLNVATAAAIALHHLASLRRPDR